MSSDSHAHEQCGCAATPSSTAQSLTELEWERGVWPAAREGDLKRVRDLLSKDAACATAADSFGYTAAHYAARAGQVDVLTELLSAGAAVDARTSVGGVTALQRACYMGRTECVAVLLAHRADPFLSDSDGRTALHKAAENGKLHAAEQLLDHVKKSTADWRRQLLKVVDKRGETAMDLIKTPEKRAEWELIMQL